MKLSVIFVIIFLFYSTAANAAGDRIYANDGTYLGDDDPNQFAPNSIYNQFGVYGSPYSPKSINNQFGQYGSPYSGTSVNNPYAQPGFTVPQNGGYTKRYGGNSGY